MCSEPQYDLTIVGYIKQADGIGRQSIGLIECLSDDLRINFVQTLTTCDRDVSQKVLEVVNNSGGEPGSVAILEDLLWYPRRSNVRMVPNSLIKIAHSMLEGSEIPSEWVNSLNKSFDLVLVPDPFLIDVYRNSGVTIPIFFIPLGVALEDFLALPLKESPHNPFVFGSTVSYTGRKNHEMLIKAFAQEFGNSRHIVLKLNGREGAKADKMKRLIASLNVNNIILTNRVLTQAKYKNFMTNLDCYVNLSMGEGFSMCPREALAMGLPCVLSDNTAQSTICKTGFVCPVPSNIEVPATYDGLFGKNIGVQYNCTIEDARAAMREVYDNYFEYLQKASDGREWVKQYLWKNLKSKYMNLFKPHVVLLGDRNEVTDTYIMTDSRALYDKYCQIAN
jgi:glycosyltransferase involved in cell wall biosynthesis